MGSLHTIRDLGRRSRRALLIGLVALAAGCTLPQQILWSLIPDGTFTTLLSNLKGLELPTQAKLGELEQRQDWAGILALADESLAKDKRAAEWWFVRGYALGRMTRWEEASDAFAEAVRIDPESLDSWQMLAQAQRFSGHQARAINTLERSLDVSRESAVTFFLLGELQRETRRFGEARSSYREALRLTPEFPEALYGLGLVETAEGRLAARDEVADRLRSLNPTLAHRLEKQWIR